MPGQFSSLHLLLHSDCTAFSYVVNTAPYSHTGNKTLNLTRTQASAGSVRGKQVSFKTCSCSVTLCFATAKFSYSIVGITKVIPLSSVLKNLEILSNIPT